jgi:TPP-dependent indolepyruvate ferredoxin oxidoreductase alpha subunit
MNFGRIFFYSFSFEHSAVPGEKESSLYQHTKLILKRKELTFFCRECERREIQQPLKNSSDVLVAYLSSGIGCEILRKMSSKQ